jgi:cellulose biosynthesis protein BcsQ
MVDIDAAYPSMGDLLGLAARGRSSSGPKIEDAIVTSPSGLDIVPANAALSAAELGLVSALNRESMLATLLKPLDARYDYILIDCLPSLGLLAINALRAADGIVIPVQADFLAVQGLAQIFETIAAVREQLNPDLRILGVLLTLVDQRTAHSREVVKVVRASLAGQVNVFETEVRLHVALKETAKAGRSILEFDSGSRSAASYRNLGREVLVAWGDTPAESAALDFQAAEAWTAKPDDAAEVADVVSEVEALLELPRLVAAAPEAADEVPQVPARGPRFAAPEFASFVGEGWQRWLGASL